MRKVKCLKCKNCLRTNVPKSYACGIVYPGLTSVFEEDYAKKRHKCLWFEAINSIWKLDIDKEEAK